MDIKPSSDWTIRRSAVLVGAAVVAATILAYLPALRAGWVWDDNNHVTQNIQLRTLHGLGEIWLRPGATPQYYPLTHTTFWIEYHLWGLRPLGFHLDNVLLHLANALMVGMILRRLDVPGYGLAAAIFALHPIEVESVAWVTERKNVLSGFFYLLALWVGLDVWSIAVHKARGTSSLGVFARYLLCVGLFVLALLSKTVAATLPVAILLLIWWKRRRVTWWEVAGLLPFLLLGAGMGGLTGWMEKHVVGAAGPDWNFTIPRRFLIASRAVWFYLGKLLWPHPLIFIYPRWNLASPLLWVYPIALLLLVAALARGSRTGLFVLLFFIVTLFPALGFVNTYPMRFSFVADHFQYLAGIGPIALAAACVRRWYIGVPILLLLGLLTWRQTQVYADGETLWRNVVALDPRSPIGHSNLGAELFDKGDFQGSETEFRATLALDANFVEAQVGLGDIAERLGDSARAEQIYRQAAADHPANPLPHFHLGLWDRLHGNGDDAKRQFALAAQYLPNPAPAFEELGEIALLNGDLGEAERQLRRTLSFDRDRADAHDNLASVDLDRTPEADLAAAERESRAALEIDPSDASAWNNLGVIAGRQGRIDEAVTCFKKALESDAAFKMARENLDKLQRR